MDTVGLKILEEVCEKRTFERTYCEHSRQVSTGPKPLYKEIQRVVRNNFQLQSLEHLSLTITFQKYRICLVIFSSVWQPNEKENSKNLWG